jgi:Lipocalin-like domain
MYAILLSDLPMGSSWIPVLAPKFNLSFGKFCGFKLTGSQSRVNLCFIMSINIAGSWRLVAWRRLGEGGEITYPLGEDASGLLIYTADGKMAVQMLAADRPSIATDDALGGDLHQRGAAYSTCLAYFGSYEVQGDSVIHRVDGSLFPNWSGTVQTRPFTCNGKELVLRTPPTEGADGTVVNELSWVREDPERDS